ncbi:MAG: SGNH/GDSL hydrolase family protein, partial [Synechococcaceae cyanobacterium]|nr:SGNH/GDSL hydrolase family protein [Synechococcaceae cyanobacterium]
MGGRRRPATSRRCGGAAAVQRLSIPIDSDQGRGRAVSYHKKLSKSGWNKNHQRFRASVYWTYVAERIAVMLKRSNLLALALGSAVALTAVADAEAKPPQFAEIWAFGDSLSDPGNFFAFTGGVEPPSILPETNPLVVGYTDGRYTDGFLWVERLAPLLGAETIYGLAIGGAYAGENNQFAPGPLGLLNQVKASGADSSDLVTIWVGANDYFAWTLDPLGSIANSCIAAGLLPPNDAAACAALVVGDIVDAIEVLHEGGARTFLIANLPDLGANPFGSALELQFPGTQGLLRGITVAHNQLLAGAIKTLRSSSAFADSSFVLLDMFTGFNELIARSERYNISQTDSGCLFRDLTDVEVPVI